MKESPEVKKLGTTPLTREAFDALSRRAPKDKVLQKLREYAFTKIESIPFVSNTHPLWRHTKPELFDFGRVLSASPTPVELQVFNGDSAVVKGVELLNSTDVSSIPDSIVSELFFADKNSIDEDASNYLQLAVTLNTAFLRVRKNTDVKEILRLSYPIEAEACQTPLVVVLLEEGASLTLFEDLSGGKEAFVFPRFEIILRDNTHFNLVSQNRLEEDSRYLARHRLHAGRDVNASIFHSMIGAGVARLDLECRMLGSGTALDIASVYIADGHRHVDIHTVQDHLFPHCRSDLLSKGILHQKGRSVYHGYIKVAEGAQRTDAYQTNRNLVFSKEARADSIPNLQIKANDVKCSHGATVGEVSEDELFYLMTRGLSKVEAENLLVQGFLDEAIMRIKDETLLSLIHEQVMQRIEYDRKGSCENI
ncbi:MAG: Fe-S cluster assembly protein SufD [SAR324 cluster bacterium]|uniref:Fe-S cluster assembly protein SufD n=1 Tax=SAR324 cluster bacterium TaxID=2024889 RepID=A0A7X9FTX0_9DELT|nr:Fe-S cluster assembly protein SufD [SAR324 cluster bacterium]